MHKKNIITTMLILCLAGFAFPSAAEIEPPRGQVEFFNNLYGWNCVVLCEELTAREGPSFEAAKAATIYYGDEFVSTKQEGEWRNIRVLRDGSKFHWLRAEYVLVDPAYYVTERETPVYAYDGTDSPRVALLGAGERLPIIKETDSGYIVSLRGASGFIRK
jgi:hypothetical protein